MNSQLLNFIVDSIADRIGLAVQAELREDPEGKMIVITPSEGHPNDLFLITIRLGWRSLSANFQPGQFSAPLILNMGKCGPEGRSLFSAFTTKLLARSYKVIMRVNGSDIDPTQTDKWPIDWKKLEMSVKILPVDIENEIVIKDAVLDMVIPFFGMIVALIGVEEQILSFEGEAEGLKKQALVTYYERKKINREACIQLFGTACCVCKFDFGEFYGSIGMGFIEVHHLKPVSEIGPDCRISIQNDLVPVCSNCHSMAHREDPPIPIERLRTIVSQRMDLIKRDNQ